MLTRNFDFQNCQNFMPQFAETSPALKNSWLRACNAHHSCGASKVQLPIHWVFERAKM